MGSRRFYGLFAVLMVMVVVVELAAVMLVPPDVLAVILYPPPSASLPTADEAVGEGRFEDTEWSYEVGRTLYNPGSDTTTALVTLVGADGTRASRVVTFPGRIYRGEVTWYHVWIRSEWRYVRSASLPWVHIEHR